MSRTSTSFTRKKGLVSRFSVSLTAQNRRLFVFTVSVSITIMLTIASVVASIYYLDYIDSGSRRVLVEVNNLAVAIQASRGAVSDAVLFAYSEVRQVERSLSPFLRYKLDLSVPVFSTPSEMDDYRVLVREYAARIKFNESQIYRWNQGINLGLLILSFFGVLLNLYFTVAVRRSSDKLLSEIGNGLDSVKALMHNRSIRVSVPETHEITELDRFFADISRISRMIAFDQSLQNIDVYGNLNLVLEELYSSITPFVSCDRIALAFLTSNGMVTAETAYTTYDTVSLYPGFSEKLEATTLGLTLTSRSPRIINDLSSYAAGKTVSSATTLLLREGVYSSIAIPLVFKDKSVGFVFFSTRERIMYSEKNAAELNRIMNVFKQKLFIEFLLQETISETARAFVTLMSEKDNETSNHIIRMSQYSYLIAREYTKSVESRHPRFLREILWFAPLHDIGKIGTPDAILRKPGPLDAVETRKMREHVEVGERVIGVMNAKLEDILAQSLMKTALEIISSHHEKFNGTGYPRGLSGKSIPLAGRIVAVADVFDALTSKRSYKPAYSIEESLDIMENKMAGHFDPAILDCLKRSMGDILPVYEQYREV